MMAVAELKRNYKEDPRDGEDLLLVGIILETFLGVMDVRVKLSKWMISIQVPRLIIELRSQSSSA